ECHFDFAMHLQPKKCWVRPLQLKNSSQLTWKQHVETLTLGEPPNPKLYRRGRGGVDMTSATVRAINSFRAFLFTIEGKDEK
ncbi:unnamed protein product, partial [Ilex paraguariensis]